MAWLGGTLTSVKHTTDSARENTQIVLDVVVDDVTRPIARSSRPADVLSRRLDSVCTAAVHPLEIAAAIEAEGVNDRIAANAYDTQDVFALAEDIYQRVPLRPVQDTDVEDHDESPAWRDLSRGLLFVLPGTLYVAAVQGFTSIEATYALLASLVFAWVWGQGSGYLGHLLIGRGADRSARRLVLWMSGAGIIVATSTSWILVGVYGFSTEIVAVSATQTTYLLATSVLLLFRKEHILFAILIPAAGAAVVTLFATGPLGTVDAAYIVIATAVTAVSLAAIIATRQVTNTNRGVLTLHDFARSIPHMAVGWAWATLVSMSVVIAIIEQRGNALLGLTIVPLLLSMGVAEWSLRHNLKLSRKELRTISDPVRFASAARRTTWRTVGGYTMMLVVLTGVAASLIHFLWMLELSDALMLISYAQLGAAFLLGQMLTSRNRVGDVLLLSLVALGIFFALIYNLGTHDLAVAYFYSTLFLAVALLIRALMTAGRVTAYR